MNLYQLYSGHFLTLLKDLFDPVLKSFSDPVQK